MAKNRKLNKTERMAQHVENALAREANEATSTPAEVPVETTPAPETPDVSNVEVEAPKEQPITNAEPVVISEPGTPPAEAKPKRKIGEKRQAFNRQRKLPEDHIIRVLVASNPKREGSAARDRFFWHKDGQSVKDYIDDSVKRGTPRPLATSDVRWDYAHQFIDVVPPEPKEEVKE